MYVSEEKKEIGILWTRLVDLENAYAQSKERILELEEAVKSAPVSQKEAKTAVNSARQYQTIVKKLKEGIKVDADNINELLIEFTELVEDEKSNSVLAKESAEEIINLKHDSEINNRKVAELYEEINTNVESLQTIISENSNLRENIDNTNELLEESLIDHKKIKNILREAASDSSNVRGLYEEIYGYEIPRDEHELDEDPTFVIGLKEKLEKSYDGLNENISESTERLDSFTEYTKNSYEKLHHTVESDYKSFIDKCGQTYEKTHSRIKELLPDALTAGLSSAYDTKKDEEELTQKDALKSFRWAIFGLVVISLIPFVIDVYLIVGLGQELVQVVSDTPKLLISILPLYFPILWMAYSSSKKANLSKRLIEEYTHKGVLSKTFEGLSTQISDVEQGDISNELRVKLLFNLLEVNSENPGKLISNYNSTDHPLMDALDKSAKLANAVEKLSKIPGFSKLASNLERKGQKLMDTADKRASAVLDEKEEEKPEENVANINESKAG